MVTNCLGEEFESPLTDSAKFDCVLADVPCSGVYCDWCYPCCRVHCSSVVGPTVVARITVGLILWLQIRRRHSAKSQGCHAALAGRRLAVSHFPTCIHWLSALCSWVAYNYKSLLFAYLVFVVH